MAKPVKKAKEFERGVEDLEDIVSRLEGGDSSLEESLDLFEKGTKLLKKLSKMLDDAERRIEVLSRDASGAVHSRPFDEETGDQ